MHHGVPVRVFFRRSSEHHSRNDSSSSSIYWSDDSHVFSHSRTLVVPGTFPRVLYDNIHHHVSFARELEEKEKKHRAGPTSSTFHFSFSCGIVYSRGNRTPESEEKPTSVYLIKRKMKKYIYTYMSYPYSSTSIYRRTTPSQDATNRIWTPQPESTRATRNTYLTHPYIIPL